MKVALTGVPFTFGVHLVTFWSATSYSPGLKLHQVTQFPHFLLEKSQLPVAVQQNATQVDAVPTI
jgi:hypothetical protein